jgi:hypothetical protein
VRSGLGLERIDTARVAAVCIYPNPNPNHNISSVQVSQTFRKCASDTNVTLVCPRCDTNVRNISVLRLYLDIVYVEGFS